MVFQGLVKYGNFLKITVSTENFGHQKGGRGWLEGGSRRARVVTGKVGTLYLPVIFSPSFWDYPCSIHQDAPALRHRADTFAVGTKSFRPYLTWSYHSDRSIQHLTLEKIAVMSLYNAYEPLCKSVH